MPQSYFFANLLMIDISEKYKKVFPDSKMLFYVDDSVIFTNESLEGDKFKKKITNLNEIISDWEQKELEGLIRSELLSEFEYVQARKNSYGILVHEPGDKSTVSNILDNRESEIYLNYIGRETSNIAFEINTVFSDEETFALFNKIGKIYEAIQNELNDVNQKIESEDDNKTIGLKALKNKLIRYKKYFKYRYDILAIRSGKVTDEIKVEFLRELKEIVDTENVETFFELYSEDIFPALTNLLLQYLCSSDEKIEYNSESFGVDDVLMLLNKLNTIIFGLNNKEISYLYQSCIRYYEKELYNVNRNREYDSLKRRFAQQIQFYKNKTDEYRRMVLLKELKIDKNNNFLECKVGKDYAKIVKLVDDNSPIIRRRMLNAYISVILGFEISDDYLLHRTINRKITYTELRILAMLRSKKFDDNIFFDLLDSFFDEEYNCVIDYSIFQVIEYFKIYVSEIDRIDKLILVHKYTCDVWKNGSKHLYFYTLHNQEHAVDLIQNSVKLVQAIDYINLKKYDYYILFIACYLHDISMVTLPPLDSIQRDLYCTDEIYTDFLKDIEDIKKEDKWKEDKWSDKSIKKLLRDYYLRIDGFYENLVRENHAKDSAAEIRGREELSFMDSALREIVAEVSAAHGYDAVDVYLKKSNARNKNWSEKYTQIILRMADLLDMSNYRVSKVVLNHNMKNMGDVSRFHWLSHVVTKGYKLNITYNSDEADESNFLKKKSITEKIILTVVVDLPQMTQVKSQKCKKMSLKSIDGNKLILACGTQCSSKACIFLCKWFSYKNKYLLCEIAALEKYLNSLPDNYFKTKIEVVIEFTDKNVLSQEQFTYLANFLAEK